MRSEERIQGVYAICKKIIFAVKSTVPEIKLDVNLFQQFEMPFHSVDQGIDNLQKILNNFLQTLQLLAPSGKSLPADIISNIKNQTKRASIFRQRSIKSKKIFSDGLSISSTFTQSLLKKYSQMNSKQLIDRLVEVQISLAKNEHRQECLQMFNSSLFDWLIKTQENPDYSDLLDHITVLQNQVETLEERLSNSLFEQPFF